MEIVTIRPDRLSITRLRKKTDVKQASLDNLNKIKSSFVISATAKKQIIESVMSLYYLSLPRYQKTSTKKDIYNFRASFLTLKLPANQQHSDVDIKKCLNVFLTSLRTTYNLDNYIWVAELQKNTNIHFHLVIDKYIDYVHLRRLWNKALAPLGYIEAYAAKFLSMTQADYITYRVNQDKTYNNTIDIQSYVKAYKEGRRVHFSQPNSVDVRSVKGNRVAAYMSKYISKSAGSELCDKDRCQQFGKLWARSQTLSTLRYEDRIEIESISELIQEFIESKKGTRFYKYDYCAVVYITIDELPQILKDFMLDYLFRNAQKYNYQFPALN